MRYFDYLKLKECTWDSETLTLVAQIREYKGKQELYLQHKSIELSRLIEMAKIQSTSSSNRIEGIATANARLKQLVGEKPLPAIMLNRRLLATVMCLIQSMRGMNISQ